MIDIIEENIKLMNLEYIEVNDFDVHSDHIKSHIGLLSIPKVRTNPDFVKIILDHVDEHINKLKDVGKL